VPAREASEKTLRILFVASEGLPFSKTGGLADVVEALPKALVAQGHEVAVVLPRYRETKATAVVMPSLTIPMGGDAAAVSGDCRRDAAQRGAVLLRG